MTRIGFVKRAILHGPPSQAAALALILLAIGIPTVLCEAVDPWIGGRTTYVTYFPAVMLAAVFLSWKEAAAVTLGSAVAVNYLIGLNRALPAADTEMWAGALVFVCASAMMIVFGQTLRRTVRELDATARREAFLASELGHRAKNHLALIEALARQCQHSGQSAEDFFAKLLPRIQTLAHAQDLLTRSGFGTCELRSLVEGALKPFADHAGIRVEGPEILVAASQCTPLIMAIHELGTNASKYGALSVPEGRVRIAWNDVAPDGSPVTLVWEESGGPPVEPPRRRGLGSRLLARHPAFERVALDFRPEGVRCVIIFAPAGLKAAS